MLNLYTAKTFDDATNGVLKGLKKNLNSSAKHIVIVPEKFTLTGEKIIFDKLDTCGIDNLEVTSFSRLAEKNLDISKKYLSSAGSLMLFTKAVLDSADKLVKYKNCKKMSGFYKEMYSVISVLRNSGIKSEELRNLNLPSSTKLKVEDISTLYDSYVTLLNENYYDATSLYEQFAIAIEDNSLFTDCYFYVLDYYFFSKVQLNIIEKLAKYSLGVNIALPLNTAKNERIFPFNTLKSLENVSQNIGSKLNVIEESSCLNIDFNHICDNMFSYEKCDKIPTDKVEIFTNENIENEVEFACIRIKKDILNGKCRYRDYSVVLGDLDSYVPIVKKMFTRYDIPFFIDKKEPMTSGAGTRFLLYSLKTVINNYDKDYMLKIASNPYSKISKEDYNCFENYILKYGINYSRFLDAFSIKNDEFYDGAERVRQKIIDMLKVFTSKNTNSEYIGCVKEYLQVNNFRETTNEFMDELVVYDNQFYLPITNQMYTEVYKVLDEFDNILGKENTTFEEFAITLENMYSDIEIGLVPVYVDSVYIGEATSSMYEKVRNMIVLGANQNYIPNYQKEAAILNNIDLDIMLKNDVYISPTPKSNNEDALFYTLQLLLTPTEKLIVSYNEQNGSSSDIIRELKYLFDINEQTYNFDISDIYKRFGEEKLKEELPSLLSTYHNMKSVFLNDISGDNKPEITKPYDAIYSLLNETDKKNIVRYISNVNKPYKINNANKLYFQKSYTFVSQIEQYFNCPYKHFMDYGLSLKDRKVAEIDSMDIGNIIHGVLETFFKITTDFNISKVEIISKVDSILEDIFAEPRMSAVREKTSIPIIKKIYKECEETCTILVDRLKYTKFVPYKFEVSFGYEGEDEININLENKTINLVGKIDRIDKYNNHIMIIDYKTGSYVSSDFKDVYSGKKIQLYMYLSALLLKNKDWKTAGVYYQPISVKYRTSETDNRYQYLGQTNKNSDILEALDNTIFENGSSVLIKGIKIKKDGSLYGTTEANCLEDKEFRNVCKYVNMLATNACREIIDGYIIPSPYENACEYCIYKGVCGFDKQTGRTVQNITKETILEAINE